MTAPPAPPPPTTSATRPPHHRRQLGGRDSGHRRADSQVAGTGQTLVVSGLTANTTYYFAIKTADEVPNWSAISNCPSGTTCPPPRHHRPGGGDQPGHHQSDPDCITLTWTAPGDDGTTGTATTYDIRYSTSAINEGNWAAATQASRRAGSQGGRHRRVIHRHRPDRQHHLLLRHQDGRRGAQLVRYLQLSCDEHSPGRVPTTSSSWWWWRGRQRGVWGRCFGRPGITSLSPYINDVGVFNLAATAASDDTKVQLTIARGVQARAKDGGPLKSASINRLDSPPPPPPDVRMVGPAYELGPDGATFEPPIMLTFVFDPALSCPLDSRPRTL